jgi:two-component system chemotaxis response regulator CheY
MRLPVADSSRRCEPKLQERTSRMPEQQKTYSIAIAEDNAVVREVVRGIIRQDKTLKLVGEAGNGQAALDIVETHKPDLLCLDVLMPGMDGIAVLRKIKADHPDTRVIIVTGQATSEVVKEALGLGAHGFVVKPFNADKLLRAIHAAMGTAS